MYNKEINGKSDHEYLLIISQVKMAATGPHEILRWAADLASLVGASEQPTWNSKSALLKYMVPSIEAGNVIIPAVRSTQELLGPDKTLLDILVVYFDTLVPSPAFDVP